MLTLLRLLLHGLGLRGNPTPGAAGPQAAVTMNGAPALPADDVRSVAPEGSPQDMKVYQLDPNAFSGETIDVMKQVISLAVDIVGWVVMYFIWKSSCMYQKRAVHPATQEQFTGDLAPVGLCDCCSLQLKSIVEAFCCEVCLIAENLEKMKSPSLRASEISFGAVAFIVLSGVFTCGLYPLYLVVSQRLELSRRPEGVTSHNNCCVECLKACCPCSHPCSNMQVATFIELYDASFEKDERTPLDPGPQAV